MASVPSHYFRRCPLLNQLASLRRDLLCEISSYAISKSIQVNVSFWWKSRLLI